MVGQQHRLGPLHVGVAGQRRLQIGRSHVQHNLLEVADEAHRILDGLLGVEAHVHRYLVVAGTGRMQLARCVAYLFIEPGFNVHVDVFKLRLPGKGPVLYLLLDSGKAADNGLDIVLGDDVLLGEHAGMRHGSGDVLPVQPSIVVQGDGVV